LILSNQPFFVSLHLNLSYTKMRNLIFTLAVLFLYLPIFSKAQSFELKRGDILVRPNNNWLPGTEFVLNGNNFGHAVIVIKGASGTNIEEVLANAEIFESNSRDVPEEFQLRKVAAYAPGSDYRYSNDSFGAKYTGKRYRLRPQLSEAQIDSVLDYIVAQDGDVSSWRAKKNTSNVVQDKHYWYCSLLIYQAFKDVLDIDLDTNGGLIVFPNDLVSHPMFDAENARLVF